VGHNHDHGPANYNSAFAIGIGLNLLYVAVEAGYGFLTGSLALVADAGHNLSDVIGLVLAWVAAVLSTRVPTPKRTYGMRRSSILAALANALLLLIAIGAIAWEAVRRLSSPEPIPANTVMIVAGIGIAINAGTAMLFMRGREGDINIKGAYLHMAADALVSVGVVVAGLLMKLTGQFWIDPVTSLVVVVVIAWGTWGLLTQSFNLAMDAVPEGIDSEEVRTYLESIDGVASVHDLHIWAMSTTETALTVHLVAPAGFSDQMLKGTCNELHDRFGIEHPTIQVETGSMVCDLEPSDKV
jgi:cobalt-zinc-cadmium efflux system protein